MQIDFHAFNDDGFPLCDPQVIPDPTGLQRPPRACFVAAEFLLAPDSFVNDVPYDPPRYFYGEKITLAISAFMHGTELYAGNENPSTVG